jgi:hypothetical protein
VRGRGAIAEKVGNRSRLWIFWLRNHNFFIKRKPLYLATLYRCGHEQPIDNPLKISTTRTSETAGYTTDGSPYVEGEFGCDYFAQAVYCKPIHPPLTALLNINPTSCAKKDIRNK